MDLGDMTTEQLCDELHKIMRAKARLKAAAKVVHAELDKRTKVAYTYKTPGIQRASHAIGIGRC